MTEAEWLSCVEPDFMLNHLRGLFRVSQRKLRLFACACCRSIWHRITDPRSRAAVIVAERFADGQVTRQDLEQARGAALEVECDSSVANRPAFAAYRTTEVYDTLAEFRLAVGYTAQLASFDEDGSDRKAQADLLRDVVGKPEPFRQVKFDRRWSSANDRAVQRLALTIYEESRFEHLPVLADALEEAGCTVPAILDHCRGPGPHVRGCWVVDTLLGKR
jgi:hypothetical protein